ncbi:unnamed protein product [Arabidopsis halleri]
MMSESEEKTCNDDSKQPKLVLELVISILQRLSFSDFHRARCVSTEWYYASKSCIVTTPWIIMFPYEDRKNRNNDSSCKLFDPRDNSSYTLRDLGINMATSRCLTSSGSWLLMLDDKLDFHLLNLFTREMIPLPPLESIDGFPMELFRMGDSKAWVTLSYKNKANRDDDNNSWKVLEPLKNQQYVDMVCKASKLYVLSDTRVTVLDFSRDDSPPIKCASFKSLDYRYSSHAKNLVVTLSGQVLIVTSERFSYSDRRFFDVYKMDPESLEWSIINSIGDEALLFDLGITVAAKDGAMENCIYFYTYQLCEYHIKTKKVVQVCPPRSASSPMSFNSARWFLNGCF